MSRSISIRWATVEQPSGEHDLPALTAEQRLMDDLIAQGFVTVAQSRSAVAHLRTVSTAKATETLMELSIAEAPDVRAWAIWAASQVLSAAEAVAVISPRVRDPDPDVADVALSTLFEIDPKTTHQHVTHLQRQTASRDFFAPVRAGWALARLGVESSEAFLLRMIEAPAYPWHAKEATVALMLLRGEHDEILDALESHRSHGLCRQLVRAAVLIATPKAQDALRRVIDNDAIDNECREFAELALQEPAKPDAVRNVDE